MARATCRTTLRLLLAGLTLAASACGGGGGGGGTSPTLQTIEVTAPAATLAKGLSQQYAATGRYSDGSTQELTATVAWTASGGASVTSTGRATAVAVGPATITATSGLIVGNASLTVTPAILVSIAVAPDVTSVPAGLTQTFAAEGVYSDDPTQVPLTGVAWMSSNEAIATIDPVTGVATGEAADAAPVTITATKDGVSGTASLLVTAPLLTSVSVGPVGASILVSGTQQFAAIAHYTDGSTLIVTDLAAWSATGGAASVSDTAPTKGLATGEAAGTATISASFLTETGTVGLDVSDVPLDSITVDPPSASIAMGRTQQFTATAHYVGGATKPVTDLVAWTSSDAVGAPISSTGLATGGAVGVDYTITATLGAKAGTATLTVTLPVLESVTVSPASASVPKGRTQQFVATGHYSDGSTQNLTATAAWTSSDHAVALDPVAGLAAGAGVGTTTIGASYDGFPGTATLDVTAPVLLSVTVAPGSATVAEGLTQAFTATGVYSDSPTPVALTGVAWTSSNTAIALVDPATGVATGVQTGLGAATITATKDGVSGTATLGVDPAVLKTITVSPASSSIVSGFTERFVATAVYSNGAKADVSSTATWAADPIGAATLDATGLATAGAVGPATISATLDGVTGTASLTVTDAVLVSLTLAPTDPTIPHGVLQQFTAQGVFSDNTRLDLTTQVAWSSSDTGIATIGASDGLAVPNASATGTVTITATLGAVQAQTSLTVTDATLDAIVVTPALVTMAAGTTQQLTATGVYSDSSTQDLTEFVTWSSSDPSVAVSTAAGSRGLATGVSAGSAQVTATLGALSDFAEVTVTEAPLLSISISPADLTLPAGITQPYVATGHFADGSTQDLTTAAAWVSSDPSTASISNAAGEEGLASTWREGAVTLSVTYASITGSTTLTVSGAALVSIEVLPAAASLPVKFKLQFVAEAVYNDGARLDVTANVTWSSSAPAVATVSNTAGTQGLATGVAVGFTTISATLGGVTGSTDVDGLEVTNATVRSIAVAPASFTIAVGGTQQLAAIATFTDDTTLDITQQCSWSSKNKKVATVSRTGLVTGVKAGATTITASKGAKRGTSAVTVQ